MRQQLLKEQLKAVEIEINNLGPATVDFASLEAPATKEPEVRRAIPVNAENVNIENVTIGKASPTPASTPMSGKKASVFAGGFLLVLLGGYFFPSIIGSLRVNFCNIGTVPRSMVIS